MVLTLSCRELYEIRPFGKGSDDALLHVNDQKKPVIGKPQTPMAGKWELVYPLNSIPSGWFFLQNASSGRLLTLRYPSFLPITIQKPDTSNATAQLPLSHLEKWASQWAIIDAKTAAVSFFSSERLPGTFVIQNRLTGTYVHHRSIISAHKGEAQTATVDAYCTNTEDAKLQEWRFEINAQSNWKIKNNQNGCLLEDSCAPLMDGYEVTCATKSSSSRKA
jgi:hypothetical protein